MTATSTRPGDDQNHQQADGQHVGPNDGRPNDGRPNDSRPNDGRPNEHPNAQDDLTAARTRAQDLVARMTTAEKISQVHGPGFQTGSGFTGSTPAIERLGVPAFTLADGPNGVGNGATGVTAFPAAISNASTWDVAALRRYGAVLATEHAGKGNSVALAPTVNIIRVPGWGRSFESLSEDPLLSGELGAAVVAGIQDRGVIADAKHFAANNQETSRDTIDVRVGERALREIYTPQFERIVKDAGVLSVMGAYNKVDGAYACENDVLLDRILKQEWRFAGFVVSDWFATHSTAPAANAGLDLEMPGGADAEESNGSDDGDDGGAATFARLAAFARPAAFGRSLADAVSAGEVSEARLDDMVVRILTARIAVGELDRSAAGDRDAVVTTPEHQRFARQLSAAGSVLLKNAAAATDGSPVLPFGPEVRSIAVIGAAADAVPIYTGGGSAQVVPSAPTTPLAGIRARAGDGVTVTYAPGTTGTDALPTLPGDLLRPAGGGTGLDAVYFAGASSAGTSSAGTDSASTDSASTDSAGTDSAGTDSDGTHRAGTPVLSQVEQGVDEDSQPPQPQGVWSATWTGTFTPPASGPHRFSLENNGTARLFLAGEPVATNYSQLVFAVGHAVVELEADRPVELRLDYLADTGFGLPGAVRLGWQPPDPALIEAAVSAARSSDVAVVVVNDVRTEGADLAGLALPGDQDALIAAVVAANPRTVVVLQTGGATGMPWLDRVPAVLETWYPGQENGNALADVLFGDAEPAGRLPVTFPAGAEQGPLTSAERFPGVADVVHYDEGLLVGYRWFDAHDQQPLFAFGHGLSYTVFDYSDLRVDPPAPGRAGPTTSVSVRVTNTGRRAGSDVVQVYLGFPPAAGEPPRRLAAFGKVTLEPGASEQVTLDLDRRAFEIWDEAAHGWTVPPGRYDVRVGRSSRDLPLSTELTIDES